MDCCQYTLPTINFVGGGTQKFAYNVFFRTKNSPFDLSNCVGRFSVVNFTNRTGVPVIAKDMSITTGANGVTDNRFVVTLDAADTANLFGKYIYQVTIRDGDNNVEPPKQGIMYIGHNIDKGFVVP